MKRSGLRTRLLVVVTVSVVVALTAFVALFNGLLARNLSGDANRLLHSRANAELTLVRFSDGRLGVGESADTATLETDAWVFAGRRIVEAPRAPAAVTAAARLLAVGPSRTHEIASADVRLLAVPIVHGGRPVGAVVAGVSLVPYEETRRSALIATLALGGAIALLVLAAAWWLLASSLRPVARMTRQAAAWSERDLGRRFALGEPHDELTELAATLDGLLERLSTSLSREQRFSAEISHELRTPLSRLLAETELALKRERTAPEYREALAAVRRNAGQLAQIVDALVAAARHEAGAGHGTADAYDVARDSVEACAALAEEQGVRVELVRPSVPIRVGVEPELAERILQPVLENACRYGKSSVSVALTRENGAVVFEIADDGRGVSRGEAEHIFEPGGRGEAGTNNGHDGAGLGLALARRLARAASGDVEAAAGSGGRFRVRLPSA